MDPKILEQHKQLQQQQQLQPHNLKQQHQSLDQIKSAIIRQNEQQTNHSEQQQLSLADEDLDGVMSKLTILIRDIQNVDSLNVICKDRYQDFVIQWQTRNRLLTAAQQYQMSSNPTKQPLAELENILRHKGFEIDQLRKQILATQWRAFDEITIVKNRILKEHLARWRREQQLMSNGVTIENPISLDLIQSWVERIVDAIYRIKSQIKALQLTFHQKPNLPFQVNELENFVNYINRHLEELIMHSLVVDKQPPQVMKTNTRFTASVRFLCGNKMNMQSLNATVKAIILSESNARTVLNNHNQMCGLLWEDTIACPYAMTPTLLQQQRQHLHHHQHQQPQQQQQQQQQQQPHQPQQSHQYYHQQISYMASSQNPAVIQPLVAAQNAMLAQQQHHQHQQIQHQHQQTQPSATMTKLQPSTQPQQLHVSYNAQPMVSHDLRMTNINTDSNSTIMSSSPEQSITMGDTQSDQNMFQQPHPQQQQQLVYQAQFPQQTATSVSAFCQSPVGSLPSGVSTLYGHINETGYNPEAALNSKDFESSGEILNGTNTLEHQEAGGQMISHFRNMQLKKIKRTEKKGTESVMDEKFVLLFLSEFRIADDHFNFHFDPNKSTIRRGDVLFHLIATSLPVVVIVHGNQEPHAWATVTWHNAFAMPDDVLYQVPDRVHWNELGHVLSEKFRSHAKRGLSKQNLLYLASKVSRTRVLEADDKIMVTWNQFSKEQLADRNFTFWEWFHSILKLTKEHLSALWRDNRIYGFVGKRGCVDLLLGSTHNDPCPVGTFLLRFSETEMGGITIAWVSNTEISMNPQLNDRVQISQRYSPTNKSTNVVMHLQPFQAKDLSTRTLADRIRDLKDLVYLFPSIPKDDAFEAYYTPINPSQPSRSSEAYVRSLLVTTLAKNYPGTNPSSVKSESSATPSSPAMDQSSPLMDQSPPQGFYQDNISMNDVMESSYTNYDQCIGDLDCTIR